MNKPTYLTIGQHAKILPLLTIAEIARRWNTSKQLIDYRRKNDPNFPQPVSGFVEGSRNLYYSAGDVERYMEGRKNNA